MNKDSAAVSGLWQHCGRLQREEGKGGTLCGMDSNRQIRCFCNFNWLFLAEVSYSWLSDTDKIYSWWVVCCRRNKIPQAGILLRVDMLPDLKVIGQCHHSRLTCPVLVYLYNMLTAAELKRLWSVVLAFLTYLLKSVWVCVGEGGRLWGRSLRESAKRKGLGTDFKQLLSQYRLREGWGWLGFEADL